MKDILQTTWMEIVFLLGVATAFWHWLEPPVFQRGVASAFVGVIALGVALGMRAILSRWRSRGVMIATFVLGFVSLLAAVWLFVNYSVERSHRVFDFGVSNTETVQVIRGLDYREGIDWMVPDDELLSDAGGAGNRYLIWTEESIIASERILLTGYTLMLLATLMGVMCFVEVLRLSLEQPKAMKSGAEDAASATPPPPSP